MPQRHGNFYSSKLVQYEGAQISELKLLETISLHLCILYNNVIRNREIHFFSQRLSQNNKADSNIDSYS